MIEPWIDPVTGATVTPTRFWLYVKQGSFQYSISLRDADWNLTKPSRDLRNRWREARVL